MWTTLPRSRFLARFLTLTILQMPRTWGRVRAAVSSVRAALAWQPFPPKLLRGFHGSYAGPRPHGRGPGVVLKTHHAHYPGSLKGSLRTAGGAGIGIRSACSIEGPWSQK